MDQSNEKLFGESRIFAPYRALGLVCNEVPVVVRYVKEAKITRIYSAVGNFVHSYAAHNLRLHSVSAPLPSNIQCLACDYNNVYAGFENKVAVLRYDRNPERFYDHDASVKFILPFGDHLVVVDNRSVLKIWEIESGEVYGEWNFGGPAFSITAVCHPATYLNKIILGSKQGPLKLVNVKTGKIIFDFDGWGAAVSCLQQSTAVDVLGIGLEDGRIFLHNIKFNETVVSFCQDWGAVTAITFRTDGPSFMLTGSTAGHVAVWDLEKRKLFNQLLDAHGNCGTGVSTLIALQNEPAVISSGADNALKTWVFDLSDGGGRLLRSQDGHGKPPTFVRFHGGERGQFVISAGGDSDVKMFHTTKSTKHKNLGEAGPMRRVKAKVKKLDWDEIRYPPITYMASDWARESGWDNIICCHQDRPLVTTWTSRRTRLGSHKLMHRRFTVIPEFRKAVAVCCTVTICGNFAVIGYSSGHVDIFNIQSGIYRGSYVDASKERAHTASITGLCSDGLNELIMTGCTEGKLKWWNFSNKKQIHSINLLAGITRMIIHRDNGLLAVALGNFALAVVDLECKRVVRLFENAHRDRMTDLTFSSSGHWVITAGMDGKMKVWDLPSSALVDVIEFPSPCIGLTMNPNGEYLATVHEGKLGIYLWINKTVFSPFITLKPLPVDYQPSQSITLPSSETQAPGSMEDETDEQMQEREPQMESNEDALPGFITYAGLPAPRWACLLDMDVIKERNKPIEPLKKPAKAPFFLPTIPGENVTFDTTALENDIQNESMSRIISNSELRPRSEFAKCLHDWAWVESTLDERQSMEVLALLKRLHPVGIEIELRHLSPINGGSMELMIAFLRLIETSFGTKRNFEICQAYLSLFVKLHRDVLWSESALREALEKTNRAQKESWTRFDDMLNDTLALVQYLKSSVI